MKPALQSLLFLLFITFSVQTYTQNATTEGQHIPDQGNGYYVNPVIAGDYGDPSVVRVGADYYMAFSRGNGFILWHSCDLVNWRPIIRHTFSSDLSMIWAVDLQYFDGKFHLYMPVNNYPGKTGRGFATMLTTSEKPEGPWSEPVNLNIREPDIEGYAGIDPGFLRTPDGRNYLYLSHGYMVKLDKTGTRAVSDPAIVYEGWEFPEEWNVECMCLESPKLFFHNGFYYMVSAQGGTSGPSTAHMTVVARSVSPEGPWVNSPYNPVTHTYSNSEKWWHQGHGTIFEDAYGDWWTIYHGRLNGYTEIGRQVLLMPITWTDDGWPVTRAGFPSSGLLPRPKGENVGHGMILSDNFVSSSPGIQWAVSKAETGKLVFGNGQLIIEARGDTFRDGVFISTGAVNSSFEVTLKVQTSGADAWGGISLGTDGIMSNGIVARFTDGPVWRLRDADAQVPENGVVYLKIKNYRKDLSFYHSADGIAWKSFGKGLRVNGSYGIRLFAWGKGKVILSDFRYVGLE